MSTQQTKPTEATNTNADCACSPCECGPSTQRDAQAATGSTTTFRPGIDVVETGHEFLIHADLPGATPDGIDIQFHEGVLSLRAKVPQRQSSKARYLVREYGIGDYERSFRVNGQIDPDHISAEMKQGVLTLRLPKPEAVRPRKIAVHSQHEEPLPRIIHEPIP